MENNTSLPEENNAPQQEGTQQPNRSGLASRINSIISSPTAAVRGRHSHSSSGANTGTNVSYEGATAPGGGGSVGTGDASGQSASGSRIAVGDEYYTAGEAHKHGDKTTNDSTENLLQKDHDDALDRSTTGTP